MKYLFFLFFFSFCTKKDYNSNNSFSVSSYKIGVVDIQDVEKYTIFIKDLQKSIIAKEKKLLSEILSKKSDLESQYKLLSQKRNTLSESSLQSEGLKLEKSFSELQNLERIYGQALEFTKSYFSKIFTDKIIAYSSEVAKEKKIDMIFPKIALLYYDEDSMIELTQDISLKINQDKNFPKFDEIFSQSLNDLKNKK